MDTFVLVDLQYLFDMTDVHRRPCRDITGGGYGGEEFGDANDGQRIQCGKSRVGGETILRTIRPLRGKRVNSL